MSDWRKIMRESVGVVLLGVASVLLTAVPALAATAPATGNGFQISPVRSELTINKGSSQSIDISVTNPTSSDLNAQAVVNDFVASSDESGNPRLLLNGNVASPSHDFKQLVGKIPNISLAAGKTKDVRVTITVPAAAAAGGYYGAIRFLPVTSSQSGNVGLTASVGTLFLITVPGNLRQKIDVVQLSAGHTDGTATSLLTSGKVAVISRLQNSGDIHVQPFGTVQVKNMFGKVVAHYQFNNTTPRANILPDSIRRFVDPLQPKSWFGRYTIQESIAYTSGSGNILTAKASFWYLPTWFVFLFIALVLLIVGVIYYVVYRRQHHSRYDHHKNKTTS